MSKHPLHVRVPLSVRRRCRSPSPGRPRVRRARQRDRAGLQWLESAAVTAVQRRRAPPTDSRRGVSTEYRHAKRSDELDGDGDSERNAAQRKIEHEVHRAERQAVGQYHRPHLSRRECAPRALQHDDEDGRQAEAQRRCSWRANPGNQLFGDRRPDLKRHHRHRGTDHGCRRRMCGD